MQNIQIAGRHAGQTKLHVRFAQLALAYLQTGECATLQGSIYQWSAEHDSDNYDSSVRRQTIHLYVCQSVSQAP